MDDTPLLSLLHGPSQPELWSKSIGLLLDDQAAIYGDNPAVIVPWQDTRLSFKQLRDKSWIVADALIKFGLRHGDRVGIVAGNRYEYLEIFLGAARIGCSVVVLNNTYTPNELQNALQTTKCGVLFIATTIGPKSMQSHIEHIKQQARSDGELSALPQMVLLDSNFDSNGDSDIENYTTFTSGHSARDVRPETKRMASTVLPDDVINLQFTSGTTGAPKAAMLTSRNIVNNGRFVGDALRLTPDDIVCCPPPLFHCFGLVLGFLACLTHGSAIVFPSDSFSANEVMMSVMQENVTVLLGVPTMFVAELEVLRKTGLKPTTLRCGLSAGSAMPAALGERLSREMGLDMVLIAYGMTETSPVTFITSMEDTKEQRLNSIGRIFPHTMAKVIDREGNILPRGQRGELCTSGFVLQKGYWMNQAKTDEVMRRDANGVLWMHTGDEVVLDDEGYGYITGRIKDMIIRGGENIFPREIEDRLQEHTCITEASVVGLPDDRYGEVVGGFLRLAPFKAQPSDAEIRQWVMEKLGRHKAPKHVFWVGESGHIADFPKTASGKHQKHILRDMGSRLLKQYRDHDFRARL
ncbi:hypothetical protein BGZ63DRAFT_471003 [Mariannaea sp. PMI_226]|nr:hypothetical protein BGZ63DRAFT_471003 [Mariannaea sp. PMI_226]